MVRPATTERRLRALRSHVATGSSSLAPAPAAALHQQTPTSRGQRDFAPPVPLPPPVFDAAAVLADAGPVTRFFDTYGFAVLGNALDSATVAWLNSWFDASQQSHRREWGVDRDPDGVLEEWTFHHSLLAFPELDELLFHPHHYNLVTGLLGGEEHVRYSDFAFRDTPPTGTAQRFHQDNGTAATSHPERIAAKHSARKHEYVCTMHYLTDVGPDSPCFSVIPQSQRFIAEGGWPEGVYNGAPEAAPDALEQFQVRTRVSFATPWRIQLYTKNDNHFTKTDSGQT